jgi:hypothetical protein
MIPNQQTSKPMGLNNENNINIANLKGGAVHGSNLGLGLNVKGYVKPEKSPKPP